MGERRGRLDGASVPPAAVLLALALVAFAGCLAPEETASAMTAGLEAESTPTVVDLGASGCRTQVLFLLVPYATSDPWLPAGFYPADLSAFSPYTVVLAGQTGAYVATLDCMSSNLDDGPLATSFVGFFVEPPEIPEAGRRAEFNFYNVAHLTQDEALSELLDGWGWDHVPLAHRLEMMVGPEMPALPTLGGGQSGPWHPSEGSVEAAAGGRDWFLHSGYAFYPQDFPPESRLRFWHETPHGLAYMEYVLPFRTIAAGPVDCSIAQGTLLSEMAGRSGDTCGYLDSFVIHLPPHDLEGTGRLLGDAP